VYPKLVPGNMLGNNLYIVASFNKFHSTCTHFHLLPLTLSMFWQLRQINKPWFLIVGESVLWNTLEVVKINHKSYFQHVATSHTPRQSLKMQFEGELWTLQKFLEPQDLIEHTPLSSSFNSECRNPNIGSTTKCEVQGPMRPRMCLDVKHTFTNGENARDEAQWLPSALPLWKLHSCGGYECLEPWL
jgi:hypothetical protein